MSRRNAAAIRELVSFEDGVATCAEESEHPEQWDGLVAAWALIEGGGTTAFDWSGHGNHGTLTNGPTWEISRYGPRVRMDGVNDYISVPHTSAHSPNAKTVMAWIEMFAYPSGNVQHVGKITLGTSGWMLYSEIVAKRFQFFNYGLSPASVQDTAMYSLNTLYHIAGEYTGSALNFYRNGVLVATTATTGTSSASSQPVQMGLYSTNGQYGSQIIQDPRLYSRPVGEANMRRIYELGPNAHLIPRRRRSAFAVTSAPTTSRLLNLRRRSAA